MEKKKTLGEILVEKKLISQEKINEALRIQTGGNRRLGHILIKMGLLTDNQLFEALSDQRGIPLADIDKEFSTDVKLILPKYLCQKYSVLPLKREEDNVLKLAMVNPLDDAAISEVDGYTGMVSKPVLAKERNLDDAIKRLIPTTSKDIFAPIVNNRFAQTITVFVVVLALIVGFLWAQKIDREKYGTITETGTTKVFSNHEIMVGVEGDGAISLIGHGPYAKGFYSVVFDDVNSMKDFINEKKDKFTNKQYSWLQWVANDKLAFRK